ncbi:MAG: aldehyde dehydrogenase [Xanthomonadales bacterium]|nr:aldehyde dehydrogenase [Xanthomonadales bacterium]
MLDILNHIDGKAHPARSGQWLDVFEPATGKPFARVCASGEAEVSQAIEAAYRAFGEWSRCAAEERARLLMAIADRIEGQLDTFAEAESRDTGKPVTVARSVDIPRAIANFRFFAAAASQFSSESHAQPGQAIHYTLRQPLGVVACISPWNLPIYLLSWKIAPALAAGNTVVAKPSEITPLTASMLAATCAEAGLPDGVLNIVHGNGPETGEPLVAHPQVKAVSFTGSTVTGRRIAKASCEQFKKLSLEMGGKNATVVFADCDFERTVDQVTRAAFSNQGQICLCGSRILVASELYDRFRDALLEKASNIRSGDPALENTRHGAIVSADHYRKICAYLELAEAEGGQLLCGGPTGLEGRCSEGWFIDPVLIEGLHNDCRTNQEEIFGPVASLIPFSGEDEALAIVNDSRYGLAGSVWTNDIARGHRFAEQMNVGIVWVNCWMRRDLRTPFGGMRESGLGREGGWEAMRFFSEPRNICIEYGHGS